MTDKTKLPGWGGKPGRGGENGGGRCRPGERSASNTARCLQRSEYRWHKAHPLVGSKQSSPGQVNSNVFRVCSNIHTLPHPSSDCVLERNLFSAFRPECCVLIQFSHSGSGGLQVGLWRHVCPIADSILEINKHHFTTVSHHHRSADFQTRLIIILQRYHTITGVETFRNVWLSFYNGIILSQVCKPSDTFDCHFTTVSHNHRYEDFQKHLIAILQWYHTITDVQTFRHV